MPFTWVPINGSYPGQTGTVTVTPVTAMSNQTDGSIVNAAQVFPIVNGSVSFTLAATDDPGTVGGLGYDFYIVVSGSNPVEFTSPIPASQAALGLSLSSLPWTGAV